MVFQKSFNILPIFKYQNLTNNIKHNGSTKRPTIRNIYAKLKKEHTETTNSNVQDATRHKIHADSLDVQNEER